MFSETHVGCGHILHGASLSQEGALSPLRVTSPRHYRCSVGWLRHKATICSTHPSRLVSRKKRTLPALSLQPAGVCGAVPPSSDFSPINLCRRSSDVIQSLSTSHPEPESPLAFVQPRGSHGIHPSLPFCAHWTSVYSHMRWGWV